MLCCEYCDYFRPISTNDASRSPQSFICDYTKYIFHEKIEELDIEYPCNCLKSKE